MPPKTTGEGETDRKKRVREDEDMVLLLEGQLRRDVTDDELEEVRQVLDGCTQGLHELRDALLQWNPDDPAAPLPVGPAGFNPAAILHYDLSFAHQLFTSNRTTDTRLAWAMVRCYLLPKRYTLKELGADRLVKEAGSATFLACGRVFIGGNAVGTMRKRFVGSAGKSSPATFRALSWVPKPHPEVVTLYSGPSGSGKTMNACLHGLGLRHVVDPPKEAADCCFLIYLVPGEEQLGRVKELEDEMAAGLTNLGANPPAGLLEELKGRRNARALNLVLSLAAGATKSPSGSELQSPLKQHFSLTVVLDEMGEFRHFTRGICANHGPIRTELAKRYGVRAKDVFLVVVGSGIDGSSASSPPGSHSTSYFFHACGVELKSDAETILASLFTTTALAPGVQRALTAIINPNGNRSRTDEGRILRWLASNVRCAALLIRELMRVFPPTVAEDLESRSSLELQEAVELALRHTARTVVTAFIRLNGLSGLPLNVAFLQVLQAIAIAARPCWMTQRLDGATWALTCKYGLLVDNAKLMSLIDAARTGGAKVDDAEFDTDAVTLLPGQRRYGIQGAHVAMALLRIGAITRPPSWEGAELLLRDYAVLCSLISPSCDYFERVPPGSGNELFPAGGWWPREMPADDGSPRSVGERNYWALRSILHQGAEAKTFCVADPLRQQVAATKTCIDALRDALRHDQQKTEPPMDKDHALCGTLLEFRRKIKNDNAAIIFINGKCAPFADVIVLSLNKVVLLQVKQFSQDKKSVDTKGELEKMDSDVNELLQALCAPNPQHARDTAIYRVIVSTDAVSNETVSAAVEGQVMAFHFHTNGSQGERQASLFFPLMARWYQPLPEFQQARFLEF